MTLRTQKIISTAAVGFTVVLGLQALIYILNLNQIGIFLHLSFWLWLYLAVLMVLWYDLHFKNPGSLARAKVRHEDVAHWLGRGARIWLAAFWERIEHYRRWTYFKHWQNYLILPALTFWATVVMFYLNFGNTKIQQAFFLLSSAALIVNFWYLKEAFHRRREVADSDVFVALSIVKIYTAGMLFGTGLGLMRQYCLLPASYAALVFCLTFFLVYQALFQHGMIKLRNIGWTLLISLVMGMAGYTIYVLWGYNFYTAGIFMAACYNLLWGVFHYHLDRVLTWRVFAEILIISLLVGMMVLQVTNFKARVLGACV